jgi:hypothetical protein
MSESGARNRRMVVSGGFSRASDFSSNESRLRRNGRVVLVLSWPSQSPMTLNGTPDRGGAMMTPSTGITTQSAAETMSISVLTDPARSRAAAWNKPCASVRPTHSYHLRIGVDVEICIATHLRRSAESRPVTVSAEGPPSSLRSPKGR